MAQQFHSWAYTRPQKNKNTNSKRQMHAHVVAALLTKARDESNPSVHQQMSGEWMDIPIGILLGHKKE